MENETPKNQTELFPDDINKRPTSKPPKVNSRSQTQGYKSVPGYKKGTPPAWVKENRSRDTECNLSDVKIISEEEENNPAAEYL